MEVEIWKLRDQSSELKGRPLRVHCATLVEVHKGLMNLKLRNGNYARKVSPHYARRVPNKPCDLPSFIKMNSDVEAKVILDDGDITYELAQVLTFLGKEDLVLRLYHDQKKVIVPRCDCRVPSNMTTLSNYKEIDKLKKYTVSVETINPENIPESHVDVEEEPSKDKLSAVESSPPTSIKSNQETQTQRSEEQEEVESIKMDPPVVDEREAHDKGLFISSMIKNYQIKLTALSSELEMKLSDLNADFRNLEARVGESLGKDWCMLNHNNNNSRHSLSMINKSTCNSVESDERSFSQSGTPNPTPPPSVGFPSQSILPHGLFIAKQNQFPSGFPGFIPMAPLENRGTMGDKIFHLISQKLSNEDAMKMTEDLLSVIF